MRGETWSVERIDLLKKLWAEGKTAAVIGARLGGLSRSAVLGKVFRLRLHTEAPAAKSGKQRSTAKGRSTTKAEAPARRRRVRRPPPPVPLKTSQYKTLLELTNNTCRWPHGRPGTERFFFCGAPEADLERGIPYCARHMRRAYTPSIGIGKAGSRLATGAPLQRT